ncbi:MAG TPA: head GIN domain-containing protein [Candidatus Kapabacteria bacterium]|nr:head GIN domain-containing protein [Candidatus Kapabacteria bacterium]
MKNTLAILCVAAIAGSAGLACCNDLSVTPGNTVTSTRDVHGFSRIDITHGFDVIVTRDTAESLTIEAPEGWQPRIQTYVTDGTLHIDVDDAVFSGSFTPRRAYLHLVNLNGISASGGSHISSPAVFTSDTFSLNGSGGSVINLHLNAGMLLCDASGSSSFTITGTMGAVNVVECSGSSGITIGGTAQSMTVSACSGGSQVHAFDLHAATAVVDASGGSAVEISASNDLNASASGGSTVRYKGHPHLTQHASGGSSIEDAN